MSSHNDAVNALIMAWCCRCAERGEVVLLVTTHQVLSKTVKGCVNNIESHVSELRFIMRGQKKAAAHRRLVVTYSDTSMSGAEYESGRDKDIMQVLTYNYVEDLLSNTAKKTSIPIDTSFTSRFRFQPDEFEYCCPANWLTNIVMDVPEGALRNMCDVFWFHTSNITVICNGNEYCENKSTRVTILRLFMKHLTTVPCLVSFFDTLTNLKPAFLKDYEILEEDTLSYGVCNMCHQVDNACEIMLCSNEYCPDAVHKMCHMNNPKRTTFSVSNDDHWYCSKHG